MEQETVRRLAQLSHIALRDDECEKISQDLASLEMLADCLEPLPSEAECFAGAVPLSALRDDVSASGLEREVLLRFAPDQDGQTILVPRTVEG